MSNLFTATIIHDRPVEYFVHNENDVYVFSATDEQMERSFKVCRVNDEWHVEGNLDEAAREQAVAQLERYLLQQH